MKWLVTGSDGMLGTDLVALRRPTAMRSPPTTRSTLDITDASAVDAAVRGHDVVVNAAAWTAVDDAEENEPAAAASSTATAPGCWRRLRRGTALGWCTSAPTTSSTVGEHAVRRGRRGEPGLGLRPHRRQAGEQAVRDELPDAHLLVRTAWLYGAHGPCFPRTIARLARERDQVDVVDDQVGQPTWTRDVAETVLRLSTRRRPGRHVPRHLLRQLQLVRLRAPGRRGRRPRVVGRAAHLERRVPAACATPGVLGARARSARPRGHRPDRRLGAALGGGSAWGAGRGLRRPQRTTAGPISRHHRAAARCQRGAGPMPDSGPSAGEAVMPSTYILALSCSDQRVFREALVAWSRSAEARWPRDCAAEIDTASAGRTAAGAGASDGCRRHVAHQVCQSAAQPVGIAVRKPDEQRVRDGGGEGGRRQQQRRVRGDGRCRDGTATREAAGRASGPRGSTAPGVRPRAPRPRSCGRTPRLSRPPRPRRAPRRSRAWASPPSRQPRPGWSACRWGGRR